ncbi:MAG: uridine phosphorylase [Gammaproteobacteria bacterium]|jgi:uridine phosphorylase|nr:uridine phosphorylase [Gammaproteobacteria bacterium]
MVINKKDKTSILTDILGNKNYDEPSIFRPTNLLRESRRQNNIPLGKIPSICILDPDGNLVDYLKNENRALLNKFWACYHSSLYTSEIAGLTVGIIPRAVGASYAVLIAEQLFVSGCELLISITSAGIISDSPSNQKFALITQAIRDEGTSYHYIPKNEPSTLSSKLLKKLKNNKGLWRESKSWTTDAPYRETESAIKEMKIKNITCVEMESSALYAFAKAKDKNVICFAHLTNTMAQKQGDFEKGDDFGSLDTITLIENVLEIFKNNLE